MKTQTPTKTSKKASKRRNRNKKRRKLRQKRNLQNLGENLIFKEPKLQHLQKEGIQMNSLQKNEQWEALCLDTYQRLISWQSEAQLNFWKARAEFLQNENQELKSQLEELTKNDDDDDDEECEIDPEYLEFIAITNKHREELKHSREQKTNTETSNE